MKLFRKENGVDVVYVQLQDLSFLIHTKSLISSISRKKYEKRIINDDSTDYIRLSSKNEVDFFKRLSFIIDRDDFESMDYNEVSKEFSRLSEEIKSKQHHAFVPENTKLISQLQYKANILLRILEAKSRDEQLPLPDFNS